MLIAGEVPALAAGVSPAETTTQESLVGWMQGPGTRCSRLGQRSFPPGGPLTGR